MTAGLSPGRDGSWPALQRVCAHYALGETIDWERVTVAPAGFSGAGVWKLPGWRGSYCLRGAPAGNVAPERLTWIHQRLASIRRAGCQIIPIAVPSRVGATWVLDNQRLWDLSPWLCGVADYQRHPTPQRLHAACESLACFHRAARAACVRDCRVARSPVLADRLAWIGQLEDGPWQELWRAVQQQADSDLRPRAERILQAYARCAPAIAQRLHDAQLIRLPLQICHGDLWHDHVLFTDQHVTGLVDFGAMKIESPATDIARLLGSLVGEDVEGWRAGVEAYRQVAPLSPAEAAIITIFDQSSVLLSGIGWLRWLLCDRRAFGDRSRVLQRLDTIMDRLHALR